MTWSFERILSRSGGTEMVHVIVVRADTHFDARQFAAARLGIVDNRQSLRGRRTGEIPDVELQWRGTDSGATQGRFLWCRERVDGVLGEWRQM